MRARRPIVGGWTHRRGVTAVLLVMAACTDAHHDEIVLEPTDAADLPEARPTNVCGLDTDGDGVPDRWEPPGDFDHDGLANVRDSDSDGDLRPDGLEASVGHPYDCTREPVDTDRDGAYDFVDLDSDGNTVPDALEFRDVVHDRDGATSPVERARNPVDTDGDGVPDYVDDDDDHDGIVDSIEVAPAVGTIGTDTDHDGLPDRVDADSDGDSIKDFTEGFADDDRDGTPNFRDDDTDGDSLSDTLEAGDTDVETLPAECPREIDAVTLDLSHPAPDGIPDFRDVDSDNDALSDRDELAAGTDRCNPDTDGDGQLDSAETAYCEQTHGHGCATSAAITIPSTDYYLILPDGGGPVVRELEFGTSIRQADVFFLFDTTGSMAAVQQSVATTIAQPTDGMVARLSAVIPDVNFGVGHYDDFPVLPYGSPGSTGVHADRALHPLCDGPPQPAGSSVPIACTQPATRTSDGYGGIVMQPASAAADVQAGALAIPAGSGGDNPESSVEALYQTVTNEGLIDGAGHCGNTPGNYPCWIVPTGCTEGKWGYPCFRPSALAVVVHFGDAFWHEGARNPGGGPFFAPYTGLSPEPHTFDQMITAYLAHGARQVHLNANRYVRCSGASLATRDAIVSPCYDMRLAAEGTGSIDLDGNALVYDLPTVLGTTPLTAVPVVTDAVQTLVTRVPVDITTQVRSDVSPIGNVNVADFVTRRVPSCNVGAVPTTDCWTAPELALDDGDTVVGATDLTTFYRVLPGTRVRFTLTFQNRGVFPGADDRATLFHALIDVYADGRTRVDSRGVYILVPAKRLPISG